MIVARAPPVVPLPASRMRPSDRHAPSPPRRRSPTARLLALLLAAAVPLQGALAQVRLPSLGESAAQDFSVGTERRIGEQIMREIRRDPDYLDDPVLVE